MPTNPTKNYRKKNVQPMRPYIPGEDLTGISAFNPLWASSAFAWG